MCTLLNRLYHPVFTEQDNHILPFPPSCCHHLTNLTVHMFIDSIILPECLPMFPMFPLLFTIVSSAPTRVTGIYVALNTYLWKEWMNPDMSHNMADTDLEDLQSFHVPATWSSTTFTSLCYTFHICKRKGSNFIYKEIHISFSRCIALYSCLTD